MPGFGFPTTLLRRMDAAEGDLGMAFLALARLDAQTSPVVGGWQVADEFEDASGLTLMQNTFLQGGEIKNQVDFTASGVTFVSNPALYGNAASFSNGWMEAANMPVVYGPDVTVEVFFRLNVNTGTQVLIETGNATNTDNCLYMSVNGGKLSASTYLSNAMTGTTTVTADVWHHAAWVLTGGQGGTAKLYLDGNLEATRTWSVPLTAPDLRFGNIHNHTQPLNGLLNGALISYVGRYTGATFAPPSAPLSAGMTGPGVYVPLDSVGVAASSLTKSKVYAVPRSPDMASLVAIYRDVAGNSVLNTDVVMSVTRSGVMVPVTMVDFGPGPMAGYRVLRGTVALGSVAPGTSMQWQYATTAKDQRLAGLWMQGI